MLKFTSFSGDYPRIPTNYPHLMFRLWKDSIANHLRSLCLRAVHRSLDIHGRRGNEIAWDILLPETGTTGHEAILILSNILEDFEDENHSPLDTALNLGMFKSVIKRYFPDFKNILGETKPWEIMKALALACQRATCFKSLDPEHTGIVISDGMRIIR